jgi:tetratricopeptide (TPR) repeat protein/transcriptional regulator with XRE-family HTH domain
MDGTLPTGASVGEELRAMRTRLGMSLGRLAALCHYSVGHISNVEHGTKPATGDFAKACDSALGTDGLFERIVLAQNRSAIRQSRSRPGQLPPTASLFVGRSPLLDALDCILDGVRVADSASVVSIDGAAGIGKTTLAVKWAHSVREQFPDGVLFSDLRGYSADASPRLPDEVLEDFLLALGSAPSDIPEGVDQRSALLRSMLAGSRTLVVLDNAADSAQVRPLLPGGPGCLVLVTSRKRLAGLAVREGAHRIGVDPLSLNESLALLREVVGVDRVDAELAAAEDLIRLCSQLPLAIRVAAERIAAHPYRSVTELTAELLADDDRLDLLAAGDDESLTVRAVFSWSYKALHDSAARLFRLLGLHPGSSVSVASVSALAGVDHAEAQLCLDELSLAHLIEQAHHGRYQLHDLLRVYAADLGRLLDPEASRRDAVHRLVSWYLHTASDAWTQLTPHRQHLPLDPLPDGVVPLSFADYADAIDWCDTELSGFTGIIQHAASVELHDDAWRLAVALFDYFLVRNPWSVWISTHIIALNSARECGDVLGQGWVLTGLGEAYRRRSDLDRAEECFTQALSTCRLHGGRIGHAWALAGLGYVAMGRARFDSAVEHLSEMVDLCREREYPFGEATGLANLGAAYRELGRLSEALDCGRTALALYESLDDQRGQAYALVRLGRTLLALENVSEARECFLRAITLNREVTDTWGAADAMIEYGRLLVKDGRTEEALDCWRAALGDFDEIDKVRAAQVREQISELG